MANAGNGVCGSQRERERERKKRKKKTRMTTKFAWTTEPINRVSCVVHAASAFRASSSKLSVFACFFFIGFFWGVRRLEGVRYL